MAQAKANITKDDATTIGGVVLRKLINDRISRAISGANSDKVALKDVTLDTIKGVEAYDENVETAAIAIFTALPELKGDMETFFKEVHEVRMSFTTGKDKVRAEF